MQIRWNAVSILQLDACMAQWAWPRSQSFKFNAIYMGQKFVCVYLCTFLVHVRQLIVKYRTSVAFSEPFLRVLLLMMNFYVNIKNYFIVNKKMVSVFRSITSVGDFIAFFCNWLFVGSAGPCDDLFILSCNFFNLLRFIRSL